MAQRLGQPSFLVRLLVLLVAVMAALWFAVGLRDAKLQSQAITLLVSAHPQTTRALALLDDAETLNVSTTPDLLRASAYWTQGQPVRAIATLRAVVHAHPENVSAWGLLARYLTDRDPAAAAVAKNRAAVLNGKRFPQG